MKTKLILILLSTCLTINSQNAPNPSFESWENFPNYSNPTSWSTPNSTTASLGIFTVTKESAIKHSGNFSAKLQSRSIFGTPIPGLLTLGNFSVNMVTMEATITGGTPFTQRPNALRGFFQYEPVSNDEAFVGVLLLKQSGSSWDTIGSGQFTTSNRIVTWTEFVANITYFSDDIPTHLNIIIVSSDINSPQANSVLYIDNLSFTYPTDINEHKTNNINAYYIDEKLIILNPNLEKIKQMNVYSIDGKLVNTKTIEANSDKIIFSVSNLSKGVYIVNILFDNNFSTNKKVGIK